ncbi:minor tail protein [Microbacterium phage Cinna]|uniref:Minor tail protein n=1 Tax=Microbacterium phage Cinna TaxID=2591215 RepID=A0A514DDE3_9CAUD|nr:minor tail protein [Microbacterium phage Cinna]QDH91617.1 minor tail protein [Microbacterium phage Cinna]
MATSGSATDPYSGRPAFNLYMVVSRYAISGTSSRWAMTLYARNPNESSLTYALDCLGWSANVAGTGFSGCHNLDFRGGQASITLGSGVSGWINQGTGTPTISFSASHGGSVFGTASLSGSFAADRLVTTVPGAPPIVQFLSGRSYTSIPFQIFQPASNGGSAVLDYRIQVATDNVFNEIVSEWTGTGSVQTVTGLTPGVVYYFRYRARNANGSGNWSPVASANSIAAPTPPVLTVAPAPNGTQATVSMVPFSGATNVTGWRIERRVQGQTTVTATNVAASPALIEALIPGTTYEWRVIALYRDGESAPSAWQAAVQPAPATNPGDYFDGSTAATPDQSYEWNGTTNNSQSSAYGVLPEGWAPFEEAANESGGTGVVHRVTGGRTGAYSARATFFSDADSDGFRLGPSLSNPGWSDVAEGGVYFGSTHVQLPKAQRLAALMVFANDAGVILGEVLGDAQAIPPSGTVWTRLVASGQAPVGATKATVYAVDVPGDMWHLWLGGDSYQADDVMVSVGALYPWFSGDTPDTAQFEYDWEGTANASPSERTPLAVSTSDPLADPDCPPMPLPPRPPIVADDCIQEVGQWRRYWAIIPENEIAFWIATIPTLTITTQGGPDGAVRQVRIRYYPNPENTVPADFDASNWEAEQIVSYIPPSTVLTVNGVSERVFASVNGADAIAADSLLYGTGGTPATWPVMACGSGYLISFDVPLDTIVGNPTIEVALTQRMT